MEALGSEAFVGCRAVTKVYIPRSLTSIGEAAFRICEGLTDVYYGGTAAEWAAISVADRNDPLLNAALHCTGQSASRLDVPAMTLGEDCSDGKPTVLWPAVTGAGALRDLARTGRLRRQRPCRFRLYPHRVGGRHVPQGHHRRGRHLVLL